jgi:hypothetical protein
LILNESPYITIKGFSSRVYNNDREEIYSYKKSDGTKVCGYSSAALFADVCTRGFWLGARTFPFVTEYEFTLEYKSLFFWPSWEPQRFIPVNSSSFTIIAPTDFKFNTRPSGEIPVAVVTNRKDKTLYTYELSDIPPIAEEDHVFSLGENLISLRFSPGKYTLGDYEFDGSSWQSLGSDCHTMFGACFELNDRQKSMIESIRDESSTQREICDKLHKAPSAETFERGYGDCKDLATLYVSMLRHVGIDAWPALVMSGRQILTDKDFPSLRFNHTIFYAIIDGDTMWADPTNPYCRMGDLPSRDEDIWALSIDSTGGELIKTTVSPPDENCILRKFVIDATGRRTVSINGELSATGNPLCELQRNLDYWEHSKLEEYLITGDFKMSKKIKFDSTDVVSDDETGTVRKIIVNGTIRNAIQSAGGKKFLNIACLSHLRDCEKVKLKDRTLPLDLDYPLSYADSIIFNIPAGWSVEKLPEAVVIDNEFGKMRVNCSVVDNKLIIACNRESYDYCIPPDRIPQFAEYVEVIKDAMPEHIVFLTQ